MLHRRISCLLLLPLAVSVPLMPGPPAAASTQPAHATMPLGQQSTASAPASNPTSKQPRYDVVSIHEAVQPLQMGGVVGGTDNMTHVIMDLRSLIAYVYSVRSEYVLAGPKWTATTPFDITAKITDPDSPNLAGLDWKARAFALQAVLAERFGLKFHHETRTLSVYELVVAKGGPKLQPPKDPNSADAFKVRGKPVAPGTMIWSDNQIRGVGVGADALAENFSNSVDRVVLDRTGLKGSYDFVLKWTPSKASGTPANVASEKGDLTADSDAGQSIFAALRDQLGLELRPAKVPTDVIVIDDAHLPTGN